MKPGSLITFHGLNGVILREYSAYEWTIEYTNARGQKVMARANKHDVKERA